MAAAAPAVSVAPALPAVCSPVPAPLLQRPLRPVSRPSFPARRLLFVLVAALLLLAACGPEENAGGGSDSLEEQTAAIARTFAAGGDLESARTALQALDVANPNQWLIYTTEAAISDPASDPETKRSLVALSLEMGFRESTIRAWAEANGLVEAQAATSAAPAATIAAAMQAPVGQPVAAQPAAAQPAAGQPAAAQPAASAPVTGSVPVSGGVAAVAAPAATIAAPAATVAAPAAAPAPAAAQASATQLLNLRQGPGIEYALAGAMNPGETATITGKNAAGDWWEIRTAGGATAWVYGPLVTTSGPAEGVTLAANIPEAPPTATPQPVAAAPAAPAEQPTAAPAEPAPQATAAPAGNPSDQPYFTLAVRRMWSKEENGACAGQHLLRITVLDANGAPLNGIVLKGLYTGATLVTGDQGKGDGRIEFDLYGSGEGFIVARNNDGREAGSDRAEGFTTRSLDIDVPTLIQGGYCTNEADCQVFYNSFGCTGHHSWEAVFKRNY